MLVERFFNGVERCFVLFNESFFLSRLVIDAISRVARYFFVILPETTFLIK